MTRDDEDAQHAALGRMVATTRALEHQAYGVARALGVLDPEMRSITPVVKEARQQAKQGLPPWSRDVNVEEVLGWAECAIAVLDHRNRHVHWQRLEFAESGRWEPYQRSLRTGAQQAFSLTDLEALTVRANDANAVGLALHRKLLFRIRDGVFCYHPGLAPSSDWSVLAFRCADGSWPSRPNRQELVEWYERLVAESPSAWGAWPAIRYAEQRAKRSKAKT